MDRTERFYKIELLLRNRGCVSFDQLREALEVSPATLKRDLQYLRERMDAPIAYDRADNGYRFAHTDAGARSRHVFSIGLDLGLPTGVLAQVSVADALGNAHILGTLLAPHGVTAIPPEIFGHLLPLFMHAVPGVIFNGVPPYSLWEHPPTIGKIPPHRTDAGCLILAECFGCKSVTLVKDVDGLYTQDPKKNPDARFIERISVSALRALKLDTLPFDEALLDVLDTARSVREFQLINGRHPERIARALRGEHVGTIVHADAV